MVRGNLRSGRLRGVVGGPHGDAAGKMGTLIVGTRSPAAAMESPTIHMQALTIHMETLSAGMETLAVRMRTLPGKWDR